LQSLRAMYLQRARDLAEPLSSRLGDRLRYRAPQGGMFIWGRLDGAVSTRELLGPALEHGFAFVPGEEFFRGPADPATLRLSYATNPPEALRAAVERLALVVGEALG